MAIPSVNMDQNPSLTFDGVKKEIEGLQANNALLRTIRSIVNIAKPLFSGFVPLVVLGVVLPGVIVLLAASSSALLITGGVIAGALLITAIALCILDPVIVRASEKTTEELDATRNSNLPERTALTAQRFEDRISELQDFDVNNPAHFDSLRSIVQEVNCVCPGFIEIEFNPNDKTDFDIIIDDSMLENKRILKLLEKSIQAGVILHFKYLKFNREKKIYKEREDLTDLNWQEQEPSPNDFFQLENDQERRKAKRCFQLSWDFQILVNSNENLRNISEERINLQLKALSAGTMEYQLQCLVKQGSETKYVGQETKSFTVLPPVYLSNGTVFLRKRFLNLLCEKDRHYRHSNFIPGQAISESEEDITALLPPGSKKRIHYTGHYPQVFDYFRFWTKREDYLVRHPGASLTIGDDAWPLHG